VTLPPGSRQTCEKTVANRIACRRTIRMTARSASAARLGIGQGKPELAVDFDPRAEDPEARRFTTDIRAEVTARRTELLAALLTIWRWGRIATVSGRGVTGPSGYSKLSLLLPLSSVITTTRTWPPDFSVRTALRRRAAS
jgi:hypothetical protein